MVEHAVVFPSRHKREARHLGKCSPRTILPVESEQRMRRFELIRGEIACDRSQSLAQFLPVMAVPFVSETAEPMIAMGLRNRCARANNLPAFAASVERRRTRHPTGERLEEAHRSGAAHAASLPLAFHRCRTRSRRFRRGSSRFPVCLSGVRGRTSRSSRNSVRKASTGASVNAAKNRERAEREGNWSRSNKAMNGTAKGWSRW